MWFDDLNGPAVAAAIAFLVALVLAIALALIVRRLAVVKAQAATMRSLLGATTDSLSDGLAVVDAEGRVVLANAPARKMFPTLTSVDNRPVHYDEVFPPYLRKIRTGEGAVYASFFALARRLEAQTHVENLSTDGRRLLIRDRRLYDGGYAMSFADVTADREQRSELERMALHDALTGLPNRVLFEDRLKLATAQAQRRKSSVAVLYVDLDLFKPVNDTYGHEGGDEVLREVGRRLMGLLRGTDTAARMGGDEFAVILQPDATTLVAARVAQRVEDELSKPVPVPGGAARVTASIGIAIFPTHGGDPTTIVQCADAAMSRAKEAGGGRFVLYDDPPLMGASGTIASTRSFTLETAGRSRRSNQTGGPSDRKRGARDHGEIGEH